MQAITIEEAPKYITELEHGESFLITKGKQIIAKLIPVRTCTDDPSLPGYGRPLVGEIVDHGVKFSPDAFAPMTEEELKEWGL
jgi:antitoxin (DNA-binding transcriptional repressor) of toxin-antitoxin stability system